MKKYFFPILFFLIIFSFISGCIPKECTVSSDCKLGTCLSPQCVEGQCVATKTPYCCGNGECESRSGENSCTCQTDCGTCSGKINYTLQGTKTSKEVTYKYVSNVCHQGQCVIGVAKEDQEELKFVGTITNSYFTQDILVTLNNPFNTAIDKVNIRSKLTKIDSKVAGGIKITNIKILTGTIQFAEKDTSASLTDLGDVFIEELGLVSSQKLMEEDFPLSAKIDYNYNLLDKNALVTRYESKIVPISSSSVSRITLVKPE